MKVLRKYKKNFIAPDDYQRRLQYYDDLVKQQATPTDKFEKYISSASRCLKKAQNMPSGTSGKVIAKQLNKASRYLSRAKRCNNLPKAAWYSVESVKEAIIEEKNKNKLRIKAEKKAKRGYTNSNGNVNP